MLDLERKAPSARLRKLAFAAAAAAVAGFVGVSTVVPGSAETVSGSSEPSLAAPVVSARPVDPLGDDQLTIGAGRTTTIVPTGGPPVAAPGSSDMARDPAVSYYNDPGTADLHRRRYALPLAEVPGLSEHTAPGSVFEMWVTWEPPVTETSQVQRLLGRVRLEQVFPPIVPEGPFVVLISVKRNQVGDLIWGHTFGSLSAVLIP